MFFLKEGQALGGLEPSKLACATCFRQRQETSETIFDRRMDIPGTGAEEVHWLRGRRFYLQHHIDLSDEHMRFTAPTDTLQFSILGINTGNLNRHGQVYRWLSSRQHAYALLLWQISSTVGGRG